MRKKEDQMENSRDNGLPFADNKDKVSVILHNLEVLKSMLAEVVSDCEDKKSEEDFVDALAEALESMDDAIDALNDAVSE